MLTSEVVRAAYARHTLAHAPDDADRAMRHLLWIALFVGCARGSAMPLFFAKLPPVAHAALSTTFLGFCAGGLSTHGAYARAFYVFASPMLVALGIAWVGTGTREGVVLAILFGMFALMMAVFAREIERLVRDSFLIRHQRDELVDQLERERQLVTIARDRAEHASSAKSRFLAAASHDLRQPLHALSLFSATLSMQSKTAETREVADSIAKAMGSMSALVDAVLDISKLDAQAIAPKIAVVDSVRLLEQAVADYRPVADRKGLALDVAACNAHVKTDPVLVDRILHNLIDNAIKYTAGGHVRVTSEIDGTRLRIAVEDSGEGIPDAEHERIFEEFYQIGNAERDRTKGLGLGLAIVRRIGRLLGTEIVLQSQVGRGSTFTFWLPLAPALPVAESDEASPEPVAESLVGRCVLVIDDEPEIRVGMRRLLEGWGCRVIACGSLAEALGLLDSQAPTPDLIVADLRLRGGECGIATIAALRQRVGSMKALLITGDTGPDRLQAVAASGLPLLHKPVSAATLRHAMLLELAR
ncbi:MAG: hybrid sensor histidine kinase/response regulator [Burkholderiales bacterium]|nr:hybrid sensor histidine kinase/response regulator [Burkholderiales bacterium]